MILIEVLQFIIFFLQITVLPCSAVEQFFMITKKEEEEEEEEEEELNE